MNVQKKVNGPIFVLYFAWIEMIQNDKWTNSTHTIGVYNIMW